MREMTNMERAVAIVNSKRRGNNPHSPGQRIVGFIVDEEVAGLSPALFALDEIVRIFNAHDELLTGLRELRGCVLDAKGNFAVDDLKAQMALRTVNSLLAKHGGAS